MLTSAICARFARISFMTRSDVYFVRTNQPPITVPTVVATKTSAWHSKQQTPDERAAELAALDRDVVRAERRLLAETLVGCLACCGVGLFLVSWAVHTSDAGWGGIAFWSGLLIGDAGMFGLLLRHALRSDAEGF